MNLPDCGDNSCVFAGKRGGMRTNGGCRCFEEIQHAYGDGPERDLLRLARQLAQERRSLKRELIEARGVARVLAQALAGELEHAGLSVAGDDSHAINIALAYPEQEQEPRCTVCDAKGLPQVGPEGHSTGRHHSFTTAPIEQDSTKET